MDSLKLNKKEELLVEIAIINLLKNRLRNNNIPLNGIFNSAISKDSSLILNDYNSFEWNSFVELKARLEQRKLKK